MLGWIFNIPLSVESQSNGVFGQSSFWKCNGFIPLHNFNKPKSSKVFLNFLECVYMQPRRNLIPDETRPGMKKFLFTREFHPGMKRVEFHPGMKFNLKENLPLSMKTYNKIYHWYVKTSDDYFFRKVTLFIIFVCLFSY